MSNERNSARGAAEVDIEEAVSMKRRQGISVGVCLPSLDEERTIGAICSAIHSHHVLGSGLVDQLIVVDCGSEDGTVAAAEGAGASVFEAPDLIPEVPFTRPGKGDALWRGLSVLREDIVIWIDSDIDGFHPVTVPALLAPLLEEPAAALSKAFYRASIGHAREPETVGGGRLTELLARPVLSMFFPHLAGLIHPLTGESAARRELLLDMSFPPGYGVELSLLIDVAVREGAERIAQVALSEKRHRHRSLEDLGRAAHEILQTAMRRVPDGVPEEVWARPLLRPSEGGRPVDLEGYEPEVEERPPLRDLGYS